MKHYDLHCILVSIILLLSSCESKKDAAANQSEAAPPAPVQAQSPKEPAAHPAPLPAKKAKAATDAFFEAALNGDIQTVEAELAAGVDVNAPTLDGQNRTALMLAAFNGHTELVVMLIDYGGDLNAADITNRTALMYAASGPFPETVQLLIDKGAKVNIIDNNEKWTALMFAAAEGQAEIVKKLLKAGADTTLKDVDGDTAADFAVQKGHTELAEMIRQYGQSAEAPEKQQ